MYRFLLWANVAPSEHLKLLGGSAAVGRWEVPMAVQLEPVGEVLDQQGLRQWTALVNMSASGYRFVEYKYIKLREDGDVQWETCHRDLMVVPGAEFKFDDGTFNEPPAPPHPLRLRGPPIPAPAPGKRVCICGSSVAAGFWAQEDHGWAHTLATVLEERYHYQTVNVAVHRYSTSRLLQDFQRLVASLKPDIVVIALSLANEGLSWRPMQEWEEVSLNFKNGMRQLLHEVDKIGAKAVLGDVYPNSGYHHIQQVSLLQDAHKFLASQNVPVLDWEAALDDGHGRWRDGLMEDAGHPNSAGHEKMFQAIDLTVFRPDELLFP
mmetsp:Transcript_66295/g.156059  ORF Transcript_66295/g.156059 Transcript_66295/m.156059 type:complete len:321 (+) Transcript_66295:88-1050(+)